MGNNSNEIKVNYGSYISAVDKIEKANDRFDNNLSNIKVSYSNCDMGYLTSYETTISNLNTVLTSYSNAITNDIASLRTTLDNFIEVDK